MESIKRSRPNILDYGIETTERGMLTWDFVENIMPMQTNYWVCTTCPDGRPHATPVWGAWIDKIFYFGGGPNTRKAKNLKDNPFIVVHTESGDDVVIIEGKVGVEQDEERIEEIQHDYQTKYGMDHAPPFWRVDPIRVFAWERANFSKSPTKWEFE